MPFLVVGISHHQAPVEVRERFAFSEARAAEAMARLRESGLAEEAVILSTCNRAEIYAACPEDAPSAGERLRQFFLGADQAQGIEIYCHEEPGSFEHLFRVSAGLDSMVLGETEIFGQIKKAYDTALRAGHTGPVLNKAFQKAFQVGKQIRTDTSIQRGNTSVASVAVELAQKIFSTLEDRRVMVIGAGETSEKVARALLSRGVGGIVVTNRSQERAAAIAREFGGTALAFDRWTEAFERIDIVISSTAAPHYVMDRVKLAPLMKTRRNRPLLLIDIAVPRDIEPEVNFMDNIYLYNIDDLQAIAADSLRQRLEEVARCGAIIREKARALAGSPRAVSAPPSCSAAGALPRKMA